MLRGARAIEVIDLPRPRADVGDVVVAVDRCGIGGSDVEAYRTGLHWAPSWFGHEWAGRVVEVGAEVTDRFEGERVVGVSPPPCGGCGPCRAGLGAHCELVRSLVSGVHSSAAEHGGFAEYVRVDARRVQRVPEAVDDSDAALAVPGAVAAHAVARAGQQLGDIVVVIGVGTVGLLVAELARLAGASRVAAVDIERSRRELACSMGADSAFASTADLVRWLRDQGHGLGADVIYDCAGRPPAMLTAVGAARQGATIVAVGRGSAIDTALLIDASLLIDRELTVRASLGYTSVDVQRALDLMADDRFRVDAIHDRIVGFGSLGATFEELAADGSPKRKILFSPRA